MFTALLHLTAKYRTNLDVSKRSTNRECNLYTIELPSVIKNHQVTGLVRKQVQLKIMTLSKLSQSQKNTSSLTEGLQISERYIKSSIYRNMKGQVKLSRK